MTKSSFYDFRVDQNLGRLEAAFAQTLLRGRDGNRAAEALAVVATPKQWFLRLGIQTMAGI
jgi:hypothetical protein